MMSKDHKLKIKTSYHGSLTLTHAKKKNKNRTKYSKFECSISFELKRSNLKINFVISFVKVLSFKAIIASRGYQ